MAGKYIMALDAGTTSNRCILFDHAGKICSVSQREFSQFYPKAGWVEHDPYEIFNVMIGVAREAMMKLGATASDIAGIGITNQRETTIVWDRTNNQPIYNAIVCEKAEKGDLLFGTVETWLIWKLTGGKAHVTDYSNASRTMLYNIYDLDWDQELLDLFNIPRSMMPEVHNCSEVYAYTAPEYLGGQIPIAGAAGDQQSALFGQQCFAPGSVKNTYGTGGFLLMNTGDKPMPSSHGLVTTIAWGVDGKITYALEGSVMIAGAVIQWLRDELHLIDSAVDTEYLASKVKDTNGCYLVPAFVGLGAPYWNPYARGVFIGLSRGVNKSHMVRAALESMAFQANDVLQAMTADSGIALKELRVDGGASANNILVQTQADLSDITVIRPACVETTAMGAAYLAGLAVGYWKDREDLIFSTRGSSAAGEEKEKGNGDSESTEERFVPRIDEEVRSSRLKHWQKAVKCAQYWTEI